MHYLLDTLNDKQDVQYRLVLPMELIYSCTRLETPCSKNLPWLISRTTNKYPKTQPPGHGSISLISFPSPSSNPRRDAVFSHPNQPVGASPTNKAKPTSPGSAIRGCCLRDVMFPLACHLSKLSPLSRVGPWLLRGSWQPLLSSSMRDTPENG